jgi:ribosomal protein S18 acetylase RimI-like enzyme
LDFVVRRAGEKDLPALGRLGAALVRLHFEFDPLRFMMPPGNLEEGYAWFLGTQLKEDDAAVFVAERGGIIVGYLYAALEPTSWQELREACGVVHDVLVAPEARRSGIAGALIEAACDWMRARKAPRVVLATAEKNTGAQQLFARLGFRRTMIEMTRELDG